jgi:hypothetical protein
LDGYGCYSYANGDVYKGQWKRNVRDGSGLYLYANGDVRVYRKRYDH